LPGERAVRKARFELVSDYAAGVALDYIAEVCEHLLPPEESNEKFFRLVTAVLDSVHQSRDRRAAVWRAVTYFSLWAVRLSGWLPELDVCLACGSVLEHTDRAFFSRVRTGLICDHCRRASGGGSSWELTVQSRALAAAMLRQAVAQIPETGWSAESAPDLRRFLVQQVETHVERRLITAQMLEDAAPRAEDTRRATAF
jgi:DNA repair protein RecO (recombination protein O)